MTFSAQELNRKITFRKATITQNPSTGEMIETWIDHLSVFAKVEPLVGRDLKISSSPTWWPLRAFFSTLRPRTRSATASGTGAHG